MCELLVGLGAVTVLGIDDETDGPLAVHVETRSERPGCTRCGSLAVVKERPVVVLVDPPAFGRPTRLVWHKRRWRCPDGDCPAMSWTEEDDHIAAPRVAISSRAARWATVQVGRCACSVNEVAAELGCDWHTANDTVVAYGEALLDANPGRIGEVTALGLDEVLMVRLGPFGRQHFSTQLVDVRRGQLLDIVPGRGGAEPMGWLARQGRDFRARIVYGTLDLSGPYRPVFEVMVPGATLVADPFHVTKVRHEAPCIRQRVRDPPLWAVAAVR